MERRLPVGEPSRGVLRMQVAAPAGVLDISTAANKAHLSRLAKAGRAQRLAPGLYVLDAILPLEAVVRHHRLEIIAHVWPGAVLCGRTALAGGEPIEGRIFLAHPEPARISPLALPGLMLVPTIGPHDLPGDMPLSSGLWLSGPARGLVENVHAVGRPAKSRAGTPTVENVMDEMARTGGAGRIQTTLGQLDVIAPSFDAAAVELVRSRLAALLGTVSGRKERISPRLRARLAGEPFDQHRLSMVASLIDALNDRAPSPRHRLPGDPKWTWLPFFEAYFSNYIEGTRFGVDEAKAIAVDGKLSKARPKMPTMSPPPTG